MTDPLVDLPHIPAPATRALTQAGYTDLRSLAGVPEAELGRLHGVGPKALRLIREALQERGLSLGQPGDWGDDVRERPRPAGSGRRTASAAVLPVGRRTAG